MKNIYLYYVGILLPLLLIVYVGYIGMVGLFFILMVVVYPVYRMILDTGRLVKKGVMKNTDRWKLQNLLFLQFNLRYFRELYFKK